MDLDRLFAGEKKVIDTPYIKIKENILIFENYILQISSISRISIVPVEKVKYPIMPFVLVIIGLMALTTMNPIGLIIGILLTGYGGFVIYKIYTDNSNRGNHLVIELNSGGTFRILFRDWEFLHEVMGVLQESIIEKTKETRIDITNSIISYGDKSAVTIENSEINMHEEYKIDWITLKDDFYDLIRKLPNDSQELEAVKKATEYATNKDQNGLINHIKSNAVAFTSNLFSSTASVFLVEFIKKLL